MWYSSTETLTFVVLHNAPTGWLFDNILGELEHPMTGRPQHCRVDTVWRLKLHCLIKAYCCCCSLTVDGKKLPLFWMLTDILGRLYPLRLSKNSFTLNIKVGANRGLVPVAILAVFSEDRKFQNSFKFIRFLKYMLLTEDSALKPY